MLWVQYFNMSSLRKLGQSWVGYRWQTRRKNKIVTTVVCATVCEGWYCCSWLMVMMPLSSVIHGCGWLFCLFLVAADQAWDEECEEGLWLMLKNNCWWKTATGRAWEPGLFTVVILLMEFVCSEDYWFKRFARVSWLSTMESRGYAVGGCQCFMKVMEKPGEKKSQI